MSPAPGQIYRHADFYLSRETGKLEPKYFIILALISGGDIVARLLTSRSHGRPEDPPCYHGNPYPSFYLGVLGGPLSAKSWVDLRGLDDFDRADFKKKCEQKKITLVTELAATTLRPLLECAANADDTSKLQERSIRDGLAKLR